MIQRIQTIFLFLAAACAFGLFGLPFATSTQSAEATSLFADGVYNIQDNVALIALFCAAGALSLISIFLYNNRKQQLLLGRFSIIADIIGIVVVLVLLYQDGMNAGAAEVEEQMGVGLPVLFLVFAFLAQRYIGKDDKLVKSMDRLR